MPMSRFEQIVFKLSTPIPPVVFIVYRTQNQAHENPQALDRNKKASAKEIRQSICTPDRYFSFRQASNTGKRLDAGNALLHKGIGFREPHGVVRRNARLSNLRETSNASTG